MCRRKHFFRNDENGVPTAVRHGAQIQNGLTLMAKKRAQASEFRKFSEPLVVAGKDGIDIAKRA